MLRILVALIVLGLLVGLPGCGSDDDGSTPVIPGGSPDLQERATCLGTGLLQLGFAMETSVALFYNLEIDVPPGKRPLGFGYDPETGVFRHSMVGSQNPLRHWELNGSVSPLEVVADGLQQGDNFTATWSIYELETRQDVAAGVFRVIHRGLTNPPQQTESLRVIPAGDIWCGADPSCRTEFTQFEMSVRHLIDDDEIRSALASFWCFNAEGDTLKGYFAGAEPTGEATISGTYDGASYTCDVDLDTYVVDCPGS